MSTNSSGLVLRRLQTIIDTGKDEDGKPIDQQRLHNLVAEVKDLQNRVYQIELKEKYEEAAKKYGWHVVLEQPPTPTPTEPPKPTQGRTKTGPRWADPTKSDPHRWQIVPMTDADKAGQFKVVDEGGKNIADEFTSREEADKYKNYYVYKADNPDTGGGGNGGNGGGGNGDTGTVTEGMIYEVKDGGFSMTKLTKSGSAGASDGLRQNFRQFPNTLLAFEASWINVSLKGDPSKSTDKPHWSIKTGTHNHDSPKTGSGRTALIEDTWMYKGSGGKARSETGDKGYGGCEGLENFNECPAFKGGETFSAKFVTYPSNNGAAQVMEWWLAMGKDSKDYKPMSRISDSGNGACECGRIITNDKTWQGPEEYLESTLRMNGADFTLDFDKSNLVEIVVPTASKITQAHAMAARKQKIKEAHIPKYLEEE